jgi:hypothetical protein
VKRAPAILLFLVLCASARAVSDTDGLLPIENPQASYLSVSDTDGLLPVENPQASYLSQNIFDDETPDAPAEKPPVSVEKPAKKPGAEEKSGENTKPAAKAKKKRGKGGKRKKKGTPAAESAKSGYSTTDVARASYEWAPETEVFTLQSSAPGIKAGDAPAAVKTAQTNAKQETIETKPPSQGFRLPQIPLAQVLIVAGFVLLFLIYRFRVGKQIKRKKY